MRMTQDVVENVPELDSLGLPEKPDGPGAAVVLAAGIGIFVLGLLTTLAVPWTDLKNFLADFQLRQGVGPLAGKTTLAAIAFFLSWGILHFRWRDKDVDLKKIFNLGLLFGLLGALGTFPPFFERF